MQKFRATVVPIAGGLLFFAGLMGISQGLVAWNAAVSPTVPWFPIPALILVVAATWRVNRRWPVRLMRPVGGRVYLMVLLMTYAVICLGVIESWLHNLTIPAPAWPDEAVSTGFQLAFLLVIPFIAALLAEIGFRGIMQTALERVLPIWPMLLLIAVINFLMHFYDPDQGSQVIRLLGLNLVWGYVTWKTQSIRPALVAHIVMNFAIPLIQYGSELLGPGPLRFGEFTVSMLAIAGVSGIFAAAMAFYVQRILTRKKS